MASIVIETLFYCVSKTFWFFFDMFFHNIIVQHVNLSHKIELTHLLVKCGNNCKKSFVCAAYQIPKCACLIRGFHCSLLHKENSVSVVVLN